jgi:mono/diheme cytochrome c family protein
VAQWQAAEEGVVIPETRPSIDTPELLAASIEAGRKLFLDEKRAQCTKCHGPTGLGDGGEVIFDDWNAPKAEALKNNVSPALVAEMWSLPLQSLKPRNLRLGIYRGGRRPVDLYRRIYVGIKGSKMPGTGPSPGNAGVLKPDEIWTLVDYVRSLPYRENSNPFWSETHVVRAGN